MRHSIDKIIAESVNKELIKKLLTSTSWQDIDFVEGDIEEDNCERLIVTAQGYKIPINVINLKVQYTRLEKYQLHIFIDDYFQGCGIGTKVYISFIHQFGGVYSGFGRVMNKEAIMSIYNKLKKEPDIEVKFVMGVDNKPIGIEAVLDTK